MILKTQRPRVNIEIWQMSYCGRKKKSTVKVNFWQFLGQMFEISLMKF